jgi:DNA-binding NtrC family response regulator
MRDDTIEHTAFSTSDDGPAATATAAPSVLEPTDLRSRVLAFERGLLVAALEATGGHQRRAAAMLGLLPTTFHEKLKRHGLLR